MSREEFTKELIDIVAKKLGTACLVGSQFITKNNNTRQIAITISKKGVGVNQVFYTTELYQHFIKGTDINEIADVIADTFHSSYYDVDIEIMAKLPFMLDKIYCRLINTEANTMFLYDVPHKEWNDLSVVYYFYLGKDESHHKMITVTNLLLELIGLSLDELDKLARTNLKREMKPDIQSMYSMVCKLHGYEFDALPFDGSMYVITNESRFNGAVSVVFEDILEKFVSQKGIQDFWIIPSSIHEMILVADDGMMDSKTFRSMIREVNDSLVAPEEVLSYNCYRYSSKSGLISVA